MKENLARTTLLLNYIILWKIGPGIVIYTAQLVVKGLGDAKAPGKSP